MNWDKAIHGGEQGKLFTRPVFVGAPLLHVFGEFLSDPKKLKLLQMDGSNLSATDKTTYYPLSK